MEPAQANPPPNRFPRLAASGSAALAIALYAITLGGTYVYDDISIIQEDERIHHAALWGKLWTGQYWAFGVDSLYRPLVSQSYALQVWLTGDRAWPLHLVNILLHAGASAAVAVLGYRLAEKSADLSANGASTRVALAAGLLFAAHPVHVEAVAFIVGRAETACALAFIAALILFLHKPMTGPRAAAIVLLTIVAMLCKEFGLLLPIVLLALNLVRRNISAQKDLSQNDLPQNDLSQKDWSQKGFSQNDLSQKDPPGLMKNLAGAIFILFAGMIAFRELVLKLSFQWSSEKLDFALQPMKLSHGVDRALLPIIILGRYARLLIFPTHFSLDYGQAVILPTAHFSDGYLWLGCLALLICIGWIILALRKRNWPDIFCLLATAITYGMISNVTLIATPMNERLIYLPSAFFITLIAMQLARLPAKTFGAILIAILILASARTFTYAKLWNSRLELYQYVVAAEPDSIRNRILLADEQRKQGDYASARLTLAPTRALLPDYADAWARSAEAEESAGNWRQAIDFRKHQFKLDPGPAPAIHIGIDTQNMQDEQKRATHPSTRSESSK
jgi:hypothetical protein